MEIYKWIYIYLYMCFTGVVKTQYNPVWWKVLRSIKRSRRFRCCSAAACGTARRGRTICQVWHSRRYRKNKTKTVTNILWDPIFLFKQDLPWLSTMCSKANNAKCTIQGWDCISMAHSCDCVGTSSVHDHILFFHLNKLTKGFLLPRVPPR